MAPVAQVLFLLVAVPVIFGVAVWALVTAFRILYPERPLPKPPAPRWRRREQAEPWRSARVGFREIHDEMQGHARRVTLPYRLDRQRQRVGMKGGVPERWLDDIFERRN